MCIDVKIHFCFNIIKINAIKGKTAHLFEACTTTIYGKIISLGV